MGSVWEKAVFIIQVKASFVRYLHLYPEDTDLLRQIGLKTLNMSISCFIKGQYAGHASHQPSCTYHNEQIHVPQRLFFARTDLKASSQTTYCTPEPRDTRGCLDGELARHPLFLFTGAVYWAESISCFVCWLLMFADWVHHVCNTCNRCIAKSSLLFSSWIICWLALKIYLDTGDSITGKTSKDLLKYNCVHV